MSGYLKSKDEVDRLARNWITLLDNMLEMIVLIRADYVIQYMNPSAISTFGDLRQKKCYDHLCNADNRCQSNCPVKQAIGEKKKIEEAETCIDDISVAYTGVQFSGYLGDNLVMLVMRDITQRVRHELEIARFNNNLEAVLSTKIAELNETERVQEKLFQEINVLKTKLRNMSHVDEMIGSSRKMRDLREMVEQVAASDATILITGESGTGKELVADMIQKCSERSDKLFLKVNCNAINDSLLESELFGYEKGAFTGAASRKKGKFEIVDGGTIFLDEIGDISPRMQAALLRVLQNGEIIRVGGNEPICVDLRVIAATNVDLARKVQDGSFRLDLFYRLNIINIAIPPLRERKDDLVDLTIHFFKHYRRAFKKNLDFLPESIINRLLLHDWPGNVRELENVIQRAVLIAKNSFITEQDLGIAATATSSGLCDYMKLVCDQYGRKSLKEIVSEFEKEVIQRCLQKNEANVQQAARELKIGKTGLYSKIKNYGLNPKMIKKM